MKESDQAATAFITPYGPFYFNTMPFGLKNAGTTNQRIIQTCLEKQISKTVEAYVDDVVSKLGTLKHSKMIYVSHLTTSARMTLSSIRKSVFSASPLENCCASSFPIEELKHIQPKFELCLNWLRQRTSNKSKNSRVAWQL